MLPAFKRKLIDTVILFLKKMYNNSQPKATNQQNPRIDLREVNSFRTTNRFSENLQPD